MATKKATTRTTKTSAANSVLSDLTKGPGDQPSGAKELANNLPDAFDIAEEANVIADEAEVGVEFVEPLLKRLEVDPVKHHVALVRVMELVATDLRFPDEPDEMSQKDLATIRQMIEDNFKVARLSAAEQRRLVKQEGQVGGGFRESAGGLRVIRDERLYWESYSSWDNYCMSRWRFSGTTGDNKIAWLEITELIEARFGECICLGVVEAKSLLQLSKYPDLLVAALVAADERAKNEERKRKSGDVKAEVERRLEYVRIADPNEMTLEEFEALIEAGVSNYRINVVLESVREKQSEGMSFQEALDATDEVVEGRKKKAEADKKAELEALNAEIKAIKEKTDLKKILDKKKALNSEFAGPKGGQLKGATITANSSESSSSSLNVVSLDKAEPADESAAEDDTSISGVRQQLADALKSLEDAFAGDWPEEDADELDRILSVAQDCEDKLAEITIKAKEHFANVEEPEAIPGE